MTDLDQLTQSLAQNLRRLRTERGLTLDALAARAGISRGMLIQIEQARTNPSVGTVVKVGDALGVSITTLLDFERTPAVRLVPPSRPSGCGPPRPAVTARCSPGPRPPARWSCGAGG